MKEQKKIIELHPASFEAWLETAKAIHVKTALSIGAYVRINKFQASQLLQHSPPGSVKVGLDEETSEIFIAPSNSTSILN
ncbi:hypothetical protein PN466_00825 [Roseofilum reptotaenium CS-1145]|uniref:Uncharacterized protein n=1 Tax=Roseofilum reptotaenium AO1-A TaxID=1925591 RepID=A0A1L9QKL9_9CYAN|nr:hypothetical protein [Roseofilum reptotaenium]MDB9515505.1 hypothetical protein [Roseofilum reptotaenium CS-1145]OJJ16942.1 hypothetical protein BI308_23285 [Roseofilum reptotaenium AO1-A]